jgi:hypothetical protein
MQRRRIEMKQYEIINMSDACTIEAKTDRIAGVAVIILSQGQYALNNEEGEQVLPLMLFGGEAALQGWMNEVGIEVELDEYVEANLEEIADALDSVMYGSFADRAAYNKGIELLDGDEAKIKEWKDHWENERRTSMTEICRVAWGYAKALRDKASEKVA